MTSSAPPPPLVTVGIPLYRSRPFLGTIRGNIRALDYPNLEIIISDRHGLDDALQVLAAEFAADGRVTCLQGTDALTWIEHFNLLLRRARGKYAVLMAHDDSYPSSYLRELVGALDASPDAVLAFGRVDQESLDGFLPTLPFSPPPVASGRPWSLADALRLLTTWQLWIAFRGAVRCEVVRTRNVYIRPTHRTVRADIYWLFGLSLIGRLLYVPSTSCTKRFYRSSTGAAWRFDWSQGWDACRVLGSYIRDFASTPIHGLAARCVVVPWCLIQPVLPRGAARRMMRAWQVHVRGGYESPPPSSSAATR